MGGYCIINKNKRKGVVYEKLKKIKDDSGNFDVFFGFYF